MCWSTFHCCDKILERKGLFWFTVPEVLVLDGSSWQRRPLNLMVAKKQKERGRERERVRKGPGSRAYCQ
jgi:hypothetical protein